MQPMPSLGDPVLISNVPSVRHLEGRIVIAVPTAFTPQQPTLTAGVLRDKIIFDCYVLDGGPIQFGDDRMKGTPVSMIMDTVPCKFSGMISQNPGIVRPLQEVLGRGAVVGRIVQGQSTGKGNPPWNLVKLDPTDPMREMANQLFSAAYAGTWTSPVARRLNPAIPPVPAATFVPPAPAPVAQPGAHPDLTAHTAAQPGYLTQSIAVVDTAPPGMEAVWPTLTPEQKATIRANMAPQPAVAGNVDSRF